MNTYHDTLLDNEIQGRFTAYLLKAVERQKVKYMQKKLNMQNHEVYLDENTYISLVNEGVEREEPNGTLLTFSDLPDDRMFIDMLTSDKVLSTYLRLSEKEKSILFLKVFKELKFSEIAVELDLNTDVVKTTYYRIIKKFRKGGK